MTSERQSRHLDCYLLVVGESDLDELVARGVDVAAQVTADAAREVLASALAAKSAVRRSAYNCHPGGNSSGPRR